MWRSPVAPSREGEGRDDSDTGGGRALPGSLEATADLVRRPVGSPSHWWPTSTTRPRCCGAVERVVAEWGGVDLLVNNAVDTGAGSMVPVLELTVEQLEAKLAANVVAGLVLVQAVLPGMLERGRGTIVDVTSHTATADPPGPVGRGGWGLAYAASKAAFHRFAPLLAVELGDRGITGLQRRPRLRRHRAPAAERRSARTGRPLLGRTAVRTGRHHRLAGGAPRGGGQRPDGQGPQDGPGPRPPPGLAPTGRVSGGDQAPADARSPRCFLRPPSSAAPDGRRRHHPAPTARHRSTGSGS